VLQHVSIETRRDDAEACASFYELIGFRRVEAPESLRDRALWVERAGTQVHVMFADDPVVPPNGHHAVVVDDYDATLAALRDAGFAEVDCVWRRGVTAICCALRG